MCSRNTPTWRRREFGGRFRQRMSPSRSSPSAGSPAVAGNRPGSPRRQRKRLWSPRRRSSRTPYASELSRAAGRVVEGDRLGAAVDAEFVVKITQVKLHRVDGDAELGSEVLVGEAARQG